MKRPCACFSSATFQAGEVNSLPFEGAAFSIVTSRCAFHHFADPARVLRELVMNSIKGDAMAVGTYATERRVFFHHPIAIGVSRIPT